MSVHAVRVGMCTCAGSMPACLLACAHGPPLAVRWCIHANPGLDVSWGRREAAPRSGGDVQVGMCILRQACRAVSGARQSGTTMAELLDNKRRHCVASGAAGVVWGTGSGKARHQEAGGSCLVGRSLGVVGRVAARGRRFVARAGAEARRGPQARQVEVGRVQHVAGHDPSHGAHRDHHPAGAADASPAWGRGCVCIGVWWEVV